jgi:hypothetical protein
MVTFDGVEPQRSRYSLDDLRGNCSAAALFDAHVIVDAHSGEAGHLFPAQAGNPPDPAVEPQSDVYR